MGTDNILEESKDLDIDEYVSGSNVIHLPGSKKLLLERTYTENSFHTLATIRRASHSKRSKTSWIALLLYLMAGLFIGMEIYLYLLKPS